MQCFLNATPRIKYLSNSCRACRRNLFKHQNKSFLVQSFTMNNMLINRTQLLCTLLCLLVTELRAQSTTRLQNSQEQFNRNVQRVAIPRSSNQSQLRFIAQPVTTKPTQFFQPQQSQHTQFRQQQNQELSPDQIRIVNEQQAFRKSVAQANAARGFQQTQVHSDVSTQQQQNFFDQNANSFSAPEQQNFQQGFSQQQFSEPQQQQFQTFQEQNNQQTFQRFIPQNQDNRGFQRTRDNQQLSVRRPVNRPHGPTFVTTQNSRKPQTPENIIRTLTDSQGFDQGRQDASFNQNPSFVQTEQPEFAVPRQRTVVKQRVKLITKVNEDEDAVREQAENAKYSFASEVNDRINDHNHIRAETRDGLKLSGVYSYSDGYFKRTVHYEADENGYRIVKEDSEPIGDGPQTDPQGTADVAANVGGTNIQYSIRAEEVPAQFFTDRTSRSDRD